MKKVKYIVLAVLLIFGLIGGAYAAWTDTLTIGGRVVTGDIDPVFSAIKAPDEVSWAYTHPEGSGNPNYDYDFLEVNYNYSEDYQILQSGKYLRVRLYNTFPDLICRKFFTITNNGTAPVKIASFKLNGADMGSPVDAYEVDATELRISLSNNGGAYDLVAEDLIIGAGANKEFFLSVHTLPTATQNNTLDYTLEIVWELATPADLPTP